MWITYVSIEPIINATTETCGGLGSSRSDLILHQLIDSTKMKSDTQPIMLYPVVL